SSQDQRHLQGKIKGVEEVWAGRQRPSMLAWTGKGGQGWKGTGCCLAGRRGAGRGGAQRGGAGLELHLLLGGRTWHAARAADGCEALGTGETSVPVGGWNLEEGSKGWGGPPRSWAVMERGLRLAGDLRRRGRGQEEDTHREGLLDRDGGFSRGGRVGEGGSWCLGSPPGAPSGLRNG
ncbi:hypothetical protein P7K49_021116, partial [Saguinus oedipus]